MCNQGDVEIIHNWKATHSIQDLKNIVARKHYSAFTVSNGQPSFGHAALKKFNFELTADLCEPITRCCNHPCRIYIYKPLKVWSILDYVKPAVNDDNWVAYRNIDMCGQGDVR